MPKHVLLLLVGALVLLVAGGLTLPSLLTPEETRPLRWSEHEEIDLDEVGDAAAAMPGDTSVQRTEIEAAAGPFAAAGEARVALLLRGRVVDRFGAPQAGAKVWLEFGRGGPRPGQGAGQRRVPDPVETDREGRFAFQGQTFRSLRVSLQVLHPRFAPALFDKDLGTVTAEADVGDLQVERGGEVVGRVTDLGGNGIAGAAVELLPENGNRMRFLRDREQLLAGASTDANGYFRLPRVAAGDWSLGAKAQKHTEGRSSVFAVENEQAIDVADIRLGPGYEVVGVVLATDGKPIAEASVSARSLRGESQEPGGREYRTTSDAQGRFTLEHLPGGFLRLDARADGYLPSHLAPLDPTAGVVVRLTLPDGLRITGTVVDEDGAPVPLFSVRAVRVRGLPAAGMESTDPAQMFERMRSGNLDPAEREAMRGQFERLRGEVEDGRRGARAEGGGRAPGGQRETARPESHPGGRFAVTGLQEGIYELLVQSPEHARYVGENVELRLGAPVADQRIRLDRGVYLAGVVRDDRDLPVVSARVTLRSPQPARRDRGDAESGRADFVGMGREFARQLAGAAWNLEATTNVDGEFVLKHLPRGTYRLQATADGFAEASVDPFELGGDRSGVVLRLGTLGAVVGMVRGLAEGEHTQARIAAVPASMGNMGPGMFRGRGQGGPFRTGELAADGSYRIEGLEPGGYLVRSWIGSPQELMRELGPRFFDGSLTADVTVRGGEDVRFDVALWRPQIGSLSGSILLNGVAGAGLSVELTRVDDGNSAARDDRPGAGGRGMWGGFGTAQQTTVAASGRFHLEGVPAGDYRLRVQQGRRRGTLHDERVRIVASVDTERHLSLRAVSVAGRVTADDGTPASERNGQIALLPGLTSLPENLNAWRRDNPAFETRIDDGAFQFEGVPPGSYLAVVTVRGRERASQPVTVGEGGATDLALPAGPARAAAAEGASEPAATPRRGQPR
ncbi:MAG: carboxypeptidase regulatory-like domain-containing protein [Planctomycetes bacterium]|nr:carboxypeptidase regulatory-like domain-containing protein [Planctomycetota bacterium]